MKILHLVLYSDMKPYIEMYHMLSEYYKKFEDIDTFFYCYRNIDEDYIIEEDKLIINGTETYTPGILNKTIMSIKILMDNKYDYVIRSNISSVLLLDKYKKYLENNDIECGGTNIGYEYMDNNYIKFISGTNIIIRSDIARKMIDDYIESNIIDDVYIGKYLRDNNYKITQIENSLRLDIKGLLDDNIKINECKKENIYLYRNRNDENRMIDIYNMNIIINQIIEKNEI